MRKAKKDTYQTSTFVRLGRKVEPIFYLLPFMLGLLIFQLYPFINVFLISLKEDYRILSGEFSGYGLKNYQEVFSDPNFINGLKNTALYSIIVVPIATALSLLFATLLNRNINFKGFFQTCYFLPMVTSATAIGLVWKWLYNYDFGLINYLFSLLGIDKVNWLNNPAFNLTAVIIYGIWSMLPFTIIMLLAGLQTVDPLYYTVARADGAKEGRIFFRITLPLLAPTVGLTLILNIISATSVFSQLFPFFNGKPGAAYNLYTVVYYLYDAFYVKWQLGRAAACAVILFVIILVFTLLQQFLKKRKGE